MVRSGRSSSVRAGRSPRLRELLVEFGATVRLTVTERQSRSMDGVVRRFLWQAGIEWPWQISIATVAAYLARLAGIGRADKTVLNHRSALSSFCEFLRSRGLLDGNPCRHVRVRRPERQLPRYLSAAEVGEVLRLARAHGIWPEVCFALSTGLRLSEIIRLQWSDVDVGRRCLSVRKSKSRRPRVVPLNRAARAALARQRRRSGGFHFVFPARQTWPGGWRYVDRPRAINWWLRALRPIQQVVPTFWSLAGSSTGRGWHLFRHTFASRAAQAGVSLYKLAAWLGHSDVRTTQIYAHLEAGFDEDVELASPLARAGRQVVNNGEQ